MEWGGVYGLAVAVEDGIGLPGVALGPDRPAGPETRITRADAGEIDAGWPSGASVREREIVHPDGDVLLSVDHHEEAGYRIDAPHHARIVVEPGGGAVAFAPREGNLAGATSVLVGQALPLAATLQGLEVLHAGAVAVNGRVAAVCANSGGGKSNVVARLVARGGALFADDALAVGLRGGAAFAHPGPAFVQLLEDDAARLTTVERLSAIEGLRSGKVALGAPAPTAAAKLDVLYLLERGDGSGSVCISREPAAMRSVLKATFVTVARTGERLRRHMDLCAVVARQADVRRVDVGGSDADDVAAAVWDDVTSR